MERNIRIYITQNEDQPIVRAVPVSVRPCDVEPREPVTSTEPAVEPATPRRRPRIVPAPVLRRMPHR